MQKIKIQWIILIGIIWLLSACTSTVYTQDSGLGDPSHPQHIALFARDNLWDAMASDFNLPDETPANPQVRAQINWYMRNQAYLRKIAKQSEPYLYYIYQQVKRRHLPAELALLPMFESNYDPYANSVVGAAGLWQIMPGTASGFGLTIDWWYDGRHDVIASTNAALDYLQYLGGFFNNQWLLAIAAYDSGEGTVDTAIKHNAKLGNPTNFWFLKLPAETQNYVPKLLALATIIKYPDEYPANLPSIKNKPYLAAVNIGSQIDLARAAKMAHMSLQELSALNPGYYRWATDPNIPTQLILPIDKAAIFERNLKTLPSNNLVTWMRYKVKRGDSLGAIAKKFKTRITLLKKVNNLHSNNIRLGHPLLIPTSTSQLTKIVLQSEQQYFSDKQRKFPEVHITNYTIKRGDTLAHIAEKFHVKAREIRFWNGLKRLEKLSTGKQLIIWPHHRKIRRTSHTIRYKVKPGDSLFGIAKKYHVNSATIQKENHIRHNLIRVGQTLYIPTRKTYHFSMRKKHIPHRIAYHVKKGDTLFKIAKKYHVSSKDLAHWNRIKDAAHLQLNQMLVMYR